MAVTATPYGAFLLALGRGQVNVETNPLSILLATNAYAPNADTHDFLDDVTSAGAEVANTRTPLAGKSWAYDATNNLCVLTASPITWPAASFTVHYAVIYVASGASDAEYRLVGYIDFGEDRVYSNTDAQLSFPSGVLRIRAL